MLLNKHRNLQSIYKMKNTLNNDLLNLEIDTEQTILTARGRTKGIGSTYYKHEVVAIVFV